MTQTLQDLRREIDKVDRALVALLAQRLKVVDHVIAVKQHAGIPAALPERIEAVVDHVRLLAAEHGVPEQLVERVWRCLIDETIAYENAVLGTTPNIKASSPTS
jgi:isochorismate pyruvate lyase